MLCLWGSIPAIAEGTKELNPSSSDHGYIQIWDNGSPSRQTGTFDCDENYRINITVCNVGEVIHFGFRQDNKDVYFRLRGPNGEYIPVNGNTVQEVPENWWEEGYISDYNEAVAGPSEIVGGTGYDALSHVTTMTGDYYIEFNPGDPVNINRWKRVFRYFDVTVADPSGTNAIPGRLWSKAWDIQCSGANNPFEATMYVYANDGITTKLDFNGIKPFGFVISANSTGVRNTGNPSTDRMSVHGNETYPEYKLFLNPPDVTCFPTGSFGSLTKVSTVTGCSEENYCINVWPDKAGYVEVLLDLEAPAGYQQNSRDRLLSINDAVVGHNCVPWDGKDGQGNPVPTGTNIDMEVNYLNGLTHLPLYDVENHSNGYKVSIFRPAGPSPALYWDDSDIGGSTNLAGCMDNNGCHSYWGDRKTVNTWWHAETIKQSLSFENNIIEADAWAGNGDGGTDVNAYTVCGSDHFVQLEGKVENADGGIWTSSGNGNFSDNTDLNGTYELSTDDINNGEVTLFLTTTGNGDCPPIKDSLTITIDQPPMATANAVDQTVCANNPVVTLQGTVSNATTASWSGGAGTFSDPGDLNSTYTPTEAEIAAGSADLTLTADPNGTCSGDSDDMTITIDPAPSVEAGSDTLFICKNNIDVPLNSNVSGSTGFTWSNGSGTFSPDNEAVSPVYTPAQNEIDNGQVNLVLTSTGNGDCNAEDDTVTVIFTDPPTADAGEPVSVCANNAEIALNGSVTVASGAEWTGGAGSFDPDETSLNGTYTPTRAEINSGSMYLVLTTTGNGNCAAEADTLHITFTPAPEASAGPDDFVCGNNAEIALNGSVSVAGGGKWLGGGGTFSPDANTLNATYKPSEIEIMNTFAELLLVTTDNGDCLPDTSSMVVVISPAPVPDAGADQDVCSNNPVVTLDGSISNASGRSWSSSGTGTFTPDHTTLNASYEPGQAEISNGSTEIYLKATKSGCLDETDTMLINFTPAPTVNAGADMSVCENNPAISLNGTVTVASGGRWTGGNGTFSPSPDELNTTYTPTDAEINSGSVKLYLTSTGNDDCNAVTDSVQVTFTPAPSVNAGNDISVCSNNPSALLAGSVSIADGGSWSGGAGTFSPGSARLNTTYTPTDAEINSGSVKLYLTSTGNDDCNAVQDSILINFTPAPTAITGDTTSVCADLPDVDINGSVTVASGGIWSGGSGKFSPDNTSLDATYSPSSTEISNGSVTLTLTTTGNDDCNAVSEILNIGITPAPTVNAGSDQDICGAESTINLDGTITNASGGQWSTSGSGTFPSGANVVDATYSPSAQDKSNGSVVLTLTTTGNGLCQPVSDSLLITFTAVPNVNAGNNQTKCTNDLPVQLNGSGSPAQWSGGSGSFSNTGSHNTVYTPASSEAGSTVTLTLTSNPSGACPQVSDQVEITIPEGPEINAGDDVQLCGNLNTVSLNGTVNNAGGAVWTSTGNGNFSPDENTTNASYTVSADDKSAGSVTLILRSVDNGPCPSVTDSVEVEITPSISVSAGPDQTFCADVDTYNLNGMVSNAGGVEWSSTGTGVINDIHAPATTYSPSDADKSNGTVSLVLTSTGNGICPAQNDTVTFTITPAPTVDAGSDATVCADTSGYELSPAYTVAQGIHWSSEGSGSFSPNYATDNAVYIPSAADTAAGSVKIRITTTDNGSCRPVEDSLTLTINPVPVVNPGEDMTVCADIGTITLQGSVDNATGGIWTSSGTGSFTPTDTDLNTGYQLSSADSSNGVVTLFLESTGNGLCRPVQEQMVVTITPAPTVNAGGDQTVCADIDEVTLNGTVTIAGGAAWTSTGTGSFANAADPVTGYTPSAADTAAGDVKLALTTTGNGDCNAVSDTIDLTITPVPVVEAGPDQVICEDSAYVQLNGAIDNATGGTWTSSGTGSFFPDEAALNGQYVPSKADRAAGIVTLTLTSSGNGTCNPVSDSLMIEITPAPTVDAGTDEQICADQELIQLNGAVTVASGGEWVSSGTGTFTTPSDLNTEYSLSSSDTASGSVTLTLRTTGNGSCKQKSASVTYTIDPAPVVNAGVPLSVCADAGTLTLSGEVFNATGGEWSSTGTGTFDDPGNLNTIYNISDADTAAGSVQLVLSSTGNGLCNEVTDTLEITITPAPVVDAGPDIEVCADTSGIAVDAFVTVANGVEWSTTGTGAFFPNNKSEDITYVPSAADTATGSVTLTLTTTDAGTCNPVSDSVVITIRPLPVVNAGEDLEVCADFEGAQMTGSILNADGGIWTSSGSGSFSPSADSPAAIYTPGQQDLDAGFVSLTLTSEGNGVCKAVSDRMNIEISPIPVVDAGDNQTVCADIDTLYLNGDVRNATGGYWQSSGTGSFIPDGDSTIVKYVPSAADTTQGNISFTLESTGNGSCNFVSSSLEVTFTPAPSVDAGSDINTCASSSEVPLNGAVTIASGAVWSTSGTGSFSPGNNNLNAKYHPSAADTSAGKVTLRLTSTGNGTCKAVKDSITLNIFPEHTVSAGADINICADTAGVELNGLVNNAPGSFWKTSSGTGSFSPDASSANAIFKPGETQINNGKATLTLTSMADSLCGSKTDVVVINISPATEVDAGPDLSVCSGIAEVNLSGQVKNATGGVWSGGAGSFDPDATTLSAKYLPTSTENAPNNSISLVLTSTGNGLCKPASDTMTINFSNLPPIDAGTDKTVCESDLPVTLEGAGNQGRWSGGAGTFLPNDSSLNATYEPTAAELSAGFVKLYLTTINNGGCTPGQDSVVISFNPPVTVDAGPSQDICANVPAVNLNGSYTTAAGIKWTSDGSGLFDDDLNEVTTYIPSVADTVSGSVLLTITTTGNGICNAQTDTMTIDFTPSPEVDAGPDQSVCATIPSVSLDGNATVTPSIQWSTPDGSGSFADATASGTSYTPSAADTAAGSVRLVLQADAFGTCIPETDTMTITFTDGPAAIAGSNTTICADSAGLPLNGAVSAASGGIWTSDGSGTFSPGIHNLNSMYIPSAADTANGSVTIRLTTTGTGDCPAEADSFELTIDPEPVLYAGSDVVVCEDISDLALSGSYANAGGILWSTGGSGSFDDATSPGAVYTPSQSERNAGTVVLFISTTGNNLCKAKKDNITLEFTPAPTIDAGFDQTVCENTGAVDLSAKVTVATGGTWSSPSGGSFADNNDLETSYTPSAADYASGSVDLAIESTGNGTCNPVSDTVTINFTPAPVSDAGSDQTVCGDTSFIALSGSVTVATGGKWSTTGTGNFSPSAADTLTQYYPSQADITAGTVDLIMRSTGNGICNAESDTLTVDINPVPTVSAGPDQNICTDIPSVILDGSHTVSTGITWSGSGTGSFDDDTDINAEYTLSPQDYQNGGIILSITTTGNGLCKEYTDIMKVNVHPSPVVAVNAGFDKTVCADTGPVQLNGFIDGAGGGEWSAVTGTGSFSDVFDLEGTYTLSSNDITNGSAEIRLTSKENGYCNPVEDSLLITVTPAPTVSAGNDTTVCADVDNIPLSGSLTVATGGLWTSSGSGTFSPSASDLNAQYIPSAADRAKSSVTLTLTTTGNGTCKAYSDEMVINLTPAPTISAGMDKIVCEDTDPVQLNSTTTVASGVQWSTGGSGSFNISFASNPSYTPSQADIDNGIVAINIITTGNGKCKPVTDRMFIGFTPAPEVDAGPEVTACADVSAVQLNGSVEVAAGGTWTTSGSGSFTPDATAINGTYNPSAADKNNDKVTLYLSTTGNGKCKTYQDSVTFNFDPVPVVDAGIAANCVYMEGAELNGAVTNAGGGVWSSSGSGAFSANQYDIAAKYYPSGTDINDGNVILTLTSTGNKTCNAVSDNTTFIVSELPLADAGDDQFICENESGMFVAATTDNVNYEWSTSTGSVISGSPFILADISSDTSFVLTVTDQQGCFSIDTARAYAVTPPTLNLDDQFCYEDGLSIGANATSLPPYNGSYTWFRNNVNLQGQQEPDLNVPSPGNYVVTWTHDKCSVSDSASVTEPPVLVSPDQIACIGEEAILNTSQYPGHTYQWTTEGIPIGNAASTAVTTLKDTTRYKVTAVDTYGCTTDDSLYIIGIPTPDPAVSDTSTCEGEIIMLDGTPYNLNNRENYDIEYNWTSDGESLATQHELQVSETGTYFVEISIGNCSASKLSNVYIREGVDPYMEENTTYCEAADTVTTLDAGPGQSWLWHETGETTRTIEATYDGMYTVTIRNANNCSLTDTIMVERKCPPRVFVPSAFHPNGNSEDKTFRVFGGDFTNFAITVYNRWGEVIFHSEDPEFEWDGTYRGSEMPQGVYPYTIQYNSVHKEFKEHQVQQGKVTLIR